MRRRSLAVLAAAALCAASCSADTESTGTTTPPTTAVTSAGTETDTPTTVAISSTTTTTAVTTTDAAAETTTSSIMQRELTYQPPVPFVGPTPTATGGGSGCSPGSGPLPDGVWFGWLEDLDDDSLEFDLACFVACDPGAEGFRIVNRNPRVRTVEVDAAATARFVFPDSDGPVEPYERILSYEEIGLHNDVWLYVNDGKVTHVVFPPGVRGCRAAPHVEVEWLATLPPAVSVAFNDLGLVTSMGDENRIWWHETRWQTNERLSEGRSQGARISAESGTVGIGDTVLRFEGSGWLTESFGDLGEGVMVLDVSEDHALLSGTEGDQVVVHALSWMEDLGWTRNTIPLGAVGEWETSAGAISAQYFAVSDTGLHTAQGQGRIQIHRWDGSGWALDSVLLDEWDTGMWGQWIDMDGASLVVGADGSTPGPGSPGGVYQYQRSIRDGSWTPVVVDEHGEGFGFDASISHRLIATAASRNQDTDSFWVFTQDDEQWRGTPFPVPDGDPGEDWVYGIDVLEPYVAVATRHGVYVGEVVSLGR